MMVYDTLALVHRCFMVCLRNSKITTEMASVRKKKTIRTRNKKHGSQVEILEMTLVGILKRTEF